MVPEIPTKKYIPERKHSYWDILIYSIRYLATFAIIRRERSKKSIIPRTNSNPLPITSPIPISE